MVGHEDGNMALDVYSGGLAIEPLRGSTNKLTYGFGIDLLIKRMSQYFHVTSYNWNILDHNGHYSLIFLTHLTRYLSLIGLKPLYFDLNPIIAALLFNVILLFNVEVQYQPSFL